MGGETNGGVIARVLEQKHSWKEIGMDLEDISSRGPHAPVIARAAVRWTADRKW